MDRVVDLSEFSLNARVVGKIASHLLHFDLVLVEVALAHVQVNQIVDRVGAGERSVELHDCVIDAILFRVDRPQTIVRLFVVGREF